MGSRKFYYYLPPPHDSLEFGRAVQVLSRQGLTFEDRVFLTTLDDHGALTSTSEQHLAPAHVDRLMELLGCGTTLEVMCNDMQIAMTCSFGSQHPEQLFSINCQNGLWRRLSERERMNYEQLLARVGSGAGACNVVIVDDAADDFLAHIEAIDGQWVIDPICFSGAEHDALTVWVDETRGPLPHMRNLRPTGRRLGAYDEFREMLTE